MPWVTLSLPDEGDELLNGDASEFYIVMAIIFGSKVVCHLIFHYFDEEFFNGGGTVSIASIDVSLR